MQFKPICRICENNFPEKIFQLHFKRPKVTLEQIKKIKESELELYYKELRLNILFDYLLFNQKNEIMFEFFLCQKCGFIFFIPCPNQEDIMKKYQILEHFLLKPKESPYLDRRQKRISNLIRNESILKVPCKMLDYGGSKGDSLKPFIDENYCFVLDYYPVKKYNEINYIKGDLNSIKESEKFDIIFLQHTLEHVYDPVNLVKGLVDHLENNGYIYIEVPLGCFKEYKIMQEPLTHINFFSEESLTYLLKKINLNIIYISTNFQYVIDQKDWCINCIAQKSNNKGKYVKIESTKKQMGYYYFFYQIFVFFERIRLRINKLLKYQKIITNK